MRPSITLWPLLAALLTVFVLHAACDDGGETDGDGDTDVDTDADGDGDESGDPGMGPPCSDFRGTCEPRVSGCARCPSDTYPSVQETDCTTAEWCCEAREAGDTACDQAGGVCLPTYPGAICPVGWESTAVDCGMGGSCCQPADGCG